jgi:peroxiredoxin
VIGVQTRRKWVAACALCVAQGCGQSKAPGHEAPAASASSAAPVAPLPVATKLLDPGDSAPMFSLLAHTGMLASTEHLLNKPVVVLFCPMLAAPNCQSTLFALRDAWHGLRPKLSMVLAVFGEDRIRLREFAYANEVPFLLLSDADGKVARAYGLGTAGSSPVQVFTVSPQKKITARLPEPSPEAVRQWLSAL